MFLMTLYGIFKRDKSQRRLVNHKGVDMCINVGRGAMMKGVRKREEPMPTLTLYCGMNGTLLRRLPYRRWLAKIFITLWTVIGTPYSIPLWKIVSAFMGANHILFASRFFSKLQARMVFYAIGSEICDKSSTCMLFPKKIFLKDHENCMNSIEYKHLTISNPERMSILMNQRIISKLFIDVNNLAHLIARSTAHV